MMLQNINIVSRDSCIEHDRFLTDACSACVLALSYVLALAVVPAKKRELYSSSGTMNIMRSSLQEQGTDTRPAKYAVFLVSSRAH